MELSRERDRPGIGWVPANTAMDTSALAGTWVNFDVNTRGIHRAAVRPSEAGLAMVIEEIDVPSPWPEVQAVPLAATVNDHRAMGFVAHLDPIGPTDPRRAELYGYVNRGLLTIVAHISDQRLGEVGNTMARAHYYRPEATS